MFDFFIDYIVPIFLTILLIFATILIGEKVYLVFKDEFGTSTTTIETQVQENVMKDEKIL